MDKQLSLSLGYSPCPNDTFSFYALTHGKIPSGTVSFRETLNDVEALNRMAMRGTLDITKVSYHAAGLLLDRYCLLRSGSALGRGCGPLLIAREAVETDTLRGKRIAIPGRLTTAFLLLSLFDRGLTENVIPMTFDRVMEEVERGNADAGLIIHEGRFTFRSRGLVELMDLGQWWEETSGLPIPLGGMAARRTLGPEVLNETRRMIRESILYARKNPEETMGYIRSHAREMDRDVIMDHIGLYVNNFSIDMGEDGKTAVKELISRAVAAGLFPETDMPIFCDEARCD